MFENLIDIKEFFIKIPICGLVEKINSKERITLNIKKETKQLNYLIDNFDKDKCYKFISVKGGFSSIAFINWVADHEIIEELFVSSLAVGKKHIENLDHLHTAGKIKNANFILGVIFKDSNIDKNKYSYFQVFDNICEKNGWKYKLTNNHSKVILMRTDKNYYVLETSSNLNENPKMEQFSFESNKKLYEFYYNFFIEVLKC